jgi:hypothetical protein
LGRCRRLLFGARSTSRCVAGRLAFPASSLALPPTRLAPDGADLRGLSHRVADRPALLPACLRPSLRLPFGAPTCCPDRLTPISSLEVGPVDRVSPAAWPIAPPSTHPLARDTEARPLPANEPKLVNHRPPDANLEVPFRPRGFSPPRRVSPRQGSQACCILQPTLGFVSFHPTGRSQPRSPRRDHPSKDVPTHP